MSALVYALLDLVQTQERQLREARSKLRVCQSALQEQLHARDQDRIRLSVLEDVDAHARRLIDQGEPTQSGRHSVEIVVHHRVLRELLCALDIADDHPMPRRVCTLPAARQVDLGRIA